MTRPGFRFRHIPAERTSEPRRPATPRHHLILQPSGRSLCGATIMGNASTDPAKTTCRVCLAGIARRQELQAQENAVARFHREYREATGVEPGAEDAALMAKAYPIVGGARG